ncbi:hypothetical protein F5148DRAFT_162206 [Russula earlei]|uniref:Uncharacterized protein n=1 Tax=Russula earlei TaxID=71964 RepID=A0ACC0U606_9AGAM|nr:hypothetical protein F5148DRAFT_162206 [Russula earlei]
MPQARLKDPLPLRMSETGSQNAMVPELHADILINVFDWYRLGSTTEDPDRNWNTERWWYTPIKVCRTWRRIIFAFPTRLDLHLVCTYGTPVEAMLSHWPPFPLIIYYSGHRPGGMAEDDRRGATFALEQRERVRRIHLAAPAASLQDLVKVMNDEYPMLQRLVIRSQTEGHADAAVTLHDNLRAPLMNSLTLSNIAVPTSSRLLGTAEGLVDIGWHNFPASPGFHPEHLVAQLSALTRLEFLAIHLRGALPNREVQQQLRGAPITRIALPSLRLLAFRGCSAYLEGILERLTAPDLRSLNVEFHNQLTFSLPAMLRFARATHRLKFRAAEMFFDEDFVSLILDPEHHGGGGGGMQPLFVQINCKSLDWQATCMSQLCRSFAPLLRTTESLTLGFHKDVAAAGWLADLDHAQWHAFLGTFGGVRTLQLSGRPVGDLYCSLQLDDGGGALFPALQELVLRGWGHKDHAFSSWLAARSAAGRPVRFVRNRE